MMPFNPQFGVPSASVAPEPFELGRLVTDGRRGDKVSYNGENHIVILGKSGSGKDTRLLIPNLLRLRDRSIVAVDPKGEMAALTAPVRARYGRVVILNPFGVLCDLHGYADYMEGCGFNPLAILSPRSPDFNKDAGLLAEALIPMTGGEKDPFFPLMARALVSFLIMVEVVKAEEQRRTPQLFNVRRMLCEPSQEGVPPSKALPYGIPAMGIPAYAQEMANCSIAGLRNKAGQFISWNKEIHSVASTARSETEFLDDPQMAYCLSRNDFDFREVKERRTTVYLVLPMDVMKRAGKWLRLVLSMALNACQRQRAPHEPRTFFFLNEFFSLGHLQIIEDNFTFVRGAGIQIALALHSIGQLKQLYDKTWETLLGNTDAVATFAPNDTETAEWFSKRSGEVGRLKTTVSESWVQTGGNTINQGLTGTGETSGFGTTGGWSYNRSASHSHEKVPAVTPYELYNMGKGEMRIIAANMGDTLHVHALPYFQMNRLIAETRPPENPYAPGVNIPRIPRRMPDYEGFMRDMTGAPSANSGWGEESGTNMFEGIFAKPSDAAGSGRPASASGSWFTDTAGAESWDKPGSGDGWGDADNSRGTPRDSSSPPPFDNLFTNPKPWVKSNPNWQPPADWREILKAQGKEIPPDLDEAFPPPPPADATGPSQPPPAQDNRTVTNNYFVNSGSGTMNVIVPGNGGHGNGNGGAPPHWVDAEWRETDPLSVPALPKPPASPLALPATPQEPRKPQAPDNISSAAQARHPGYTPDPKHGGDDWGYADDGSWDGPRPPSDDTF